MNVQEFLTMLDDRFDDGRRYPTLDEWAEAIAEVQRLRAAAAPHPAQPWLAEAHRQLVRGRHGPERVSAYESPAALDRLAKKLSRGS